MRVLILLLALAQIACAGKLTRAESFEHWTRYYEVRMGLAPAQVKFGPPPDSRCEQVIWEQWLGRDGMEATLVVWYDPGATLCRAPWDLALHAACHRRMQHHHFKQEAVDALGIDVEAEADACEASYTNIGRNRY